MILTSILSLILVTLISYKYLSRRKRHVEQENTWLSYFDNCTEEYRLALEDYKSNGKVALKKYERAI